MELRLDTSSVDVSDLELLSTVVCVDEELQIFVEGLLVFFVAWHCDQ